MATLRERANGTFEIQFWDEYRQRKTITLSGRRFKKPTAERLREAVKVLINKKINDDPTQHKRTKDWIEAAPLEIREKLARFGLWQVSSRHTVTELWDTFLEGYKFNTESTKQTYLDAKRRFFMFPKVKPNELIAKLTPDRIKE